MLVVAVKNHQYSGRAIRAGQQYNVRDIDVPVLFAANLARKIVKTVSTGPRLEMSRTEGVRIYNDREEETILVDATELDDEQPVERPKRRYRRKDMVPEK